METELRLAPPIRFSPREHRRAGLNRRPNRCRGEEARPREECRQGFDARFRRRPCTPGTVRRSEPDGREPATAFRKRCIYSAQTWTGAPDFNGRFDGGPGVCGHLTVYASTESDPSLFVL